jgi:hypothetical protein
LAGVFSIRGGTRADEHSLGNPRAAMTADIAGDFATSSGVADVDRGLQVKLLDQRREVIGVGVHFVAFPGLA